VARRGRGRRALRAGEASGVDATDVLEAPADAATRVQLSDTATLTLDAASRAGTIVADATVTTADYAPAFEAVRLVRGARTSRCASCTAGSASTC
jgi:hypothetical protein